MLNGDDATVRQLRPAAPPPTAPAAEQTAADKPTETTTDPADKPADKPVDTTTDPAEKSAETTTDAAEKPAETTGAGPAHRRRLRFTHALRRIPPPRRIVATTARAVAAWSRRPSGRLALSGLLLLLLVSVTGTAGALLVPAAIRAPQPTVTADPGTDPDLTVPDTSAVPAQPGLPGGPTANPTTNPPGGSPGRPSDVLAGWAQQVGSRVGVPPAAMQAYGYAEWVVGQTTPACKLSWTTLAAIGKVESDHGRFRGAVLGVDGQVRPNIIGPPLDGQGGRQRITDTDQGQLDGDTVYDRAIGPMQFIPTTWRQDGVDADDDGVKNPQDIDDAALAAANYLCKNGRDLSRPQDWWNAILSYNNVQAYAQQVFDTANQYGTASRS